MALGGEGAEMPDGERCSGPGAAGDRVEEYPVCTGVSSPPDGPDVTEGGGSSTAPGMDQSKT